MGAQITEQQRKMMEKQVEMMKAALPKIAYCQPAWYKNIDEAILNADKIKPYVDMCIIVTDVDPLPNNKDIIFVNRPWNDDFPTYHNYLLDAARANGADYVLASDPDEKFSINFLQALKPFVYMNPQFNGFELYCSLNIENHERLDAGTLAREAPAGLGMDSHSWKLLLWKLEPMTKYLPTGRAAKCVHHTIRGNWNIIKLPPKFLYDHNKYYYDVWASSARNLFICGGGDNEGDANPFHVELRKICDRIGITTYRQFVQYCERGKIDGELAELILQHRNDSDKYYSSEIRDMFHWYYDYLHPEENINLLRSEYVAPATPEALAEEIVQRSYFKALGRHSDGKGKADYILKVLSGMTEEQVQTDMRKSDEYVKNAVNTTCCEFMNRGATVMEQKVWGALMLNGGIDDITKVMYEIRRFMYVTIAYCQMTYAHDFDATLDNVKSAMGKVDVCIVVYDDTLSLEQIDALKEAGAIAKYYKWHENFPMQRNNYLQEARAYGANWVMVSDPDEHFDTKLLLNAKILAQQADLMGVNMMMINSHDVFTDDEQCKPLAKPQEMVPDYHKNLFFKLNPDVAYIGIGETQNLHESMTGSFRSINLPREYFYRHIKSHAEICEHSARNIHVAGGGMNKGTEIPHWKEFKAIEKELGINTWYELKAYLVKGNIAPKLREFIIKHRNDYGHDYDSEYRELFTYYFVLLHPEENWNDLKIEVNDSGFVAPKMDDVETYVNDSYKKYLRRDADPSGLQHYSGLIKNGLMKKEDLANVLQSSEEYKAIVRVIPNAATS
jgi:hypothetical protein